MKLKLIRKVSEAKDTKSFFWKPEKEVRYLPGQYFYFTLSKLNYPDHRGATRHFTIASSPTEGELLMITTRIREESGYKKTLDSLPVGSIIEGEGPNGTFIFDEQERGSHIFLAGGIGITPFRSFIKFNTDKNLKITMYLIYSNSGSDFPFKKELNKWSKENEFIKINFINTSVSGHIDLIKIEKLIKNWKLIIKNCIFWVVGSPSFANTLESILKQLGINSDKIRVEKFTGY